MKNQMRFLTIIFLLFTAIIYTSRSTAAETFVTFETGEVNLTDMHGKIKVEEGDWKGVVRAVEDLKQDLTKVTGRADYPITIGTLGKSHALDKIAEENPRIKKELEGKWEKYIISVSEDGIVIAGSDRRGTIYGIYELCQQLGVSPWYWWADVPVIARDKVYLKSGIYSDGEPAVKYRGIFINDEWPSFGGWATKHFGGINSKMYAHMFELLLRLKANYLWPAMWGSAFNEDDPHSQSLADEYGIVMGTSHHEPMMRAHKEYTRRREEIGAWDYIGNHEKIEKFFTEGLERAKNFENIITIGMRGDGDVALGKNDEECINSLKSIIAGQRNIIETVYGKPATEIAQLWAIFTEVQRYYDAGLTVPDDVTLLFCDNNWGYLRRTGPSEERKRKGGMGLYYHIDMNGGPWNDRWVNTTTVAKLREQLWLAYSTGIDRIWIINVGDLKPKEMPIDFIMRYAWNPEAIGPNDCQQWMENWACGIFGRAHAREIADIVAEYSKLNLERKPEVQHVGIYNKEEAARMVERWLDLENRAIALSEKIDSRFKDTYYQLVEYPAVASSGVARIYLAATLGDSIDMQRLFERDKQLTERYNKEIAGGKWDGYMQDKHIGYTKWSMPEEDTLAPLYEQMKVEISPTTSASETAIMAHDYSRKTAGCDGSEWIFLPGLGRGKGDMGVWPVTTPSHPDGDGAAMEFEFDGPASRLALGILPTNDINPARGLRIGISIDNGEMQIIDARQGMHDEFREYTKENLARSANLRPLPQRPFETYLSGGGKPMRTEVFDNLRWLSIELGKPDPGRHTLRIIMIDPEIVVEKLIINPDNNNPSYYGKGAE